MPANIPARSSPIPRPKRPRGPRFRPTRGIAAALFILILALGLPLLVLPLARQYRNSGSYDVATRRVTRDALRENVKQLQAARTAFGKLDKDFEEKLMLALPPDPDAAGIMVTLDGLAKNSGMQLTSIDIALQKNPVVGVPGALPVEIGISVAGGDYQRLKSFLSAIERTLRIMDVTGVAFSPRGASYALSIRSYTRLSR